MMQNEYRHSNSETLADYMVYMYNIREVVEETVVGYYYVVAGNNRNKIFEDGSVFAVEIDYLSGEAANGGVFK